MAQTLDDAARTMVHKDIRISEVGVKVCYSFDGNMFQAELVTDFCLGPMI